MDQRDGYARTDQPRLPERAVACMDAGSAAVRALGPEMTQRMCSEASTTVAHDRPEGRAVLKIAMSSYGVLALLLSEQS